MSRKKSKLIAAAVLGAVGGVSGSSALATSGTWQSSATSGNWSDTGNWGVSPVPGSTDNATFNNGGNGFTTIAIGSSRAVKAIFFDTNTVNYTIDGRGLYI